MKIASLALFTAFVAVSDASGFGNLVKKMTKRDATAPVVEAEAEATAPEAESASTLSDSSSEERELQTVSNCWGGQTPSPAWHPQYSKGWTNGHCLFTVDCNSPSYATELACCKGAYAGQISGTCLGSLPSPPTMSPTESGGLDVYYPDYDTAWTEAGCINERPLPSGRPKYATMVACCKGAYGGQVSGKCLSMLPSPPTTSPTISGGLAAFWYPDYDTSWAEAGCLNTLPLPFNNPNDRPNYDTQIACCKGAYAGQVSGKCLSMLPSPPTMSPTESGQLGIYYPDYDTAWSEATCKNDRPMPFNTGDRPTYSTMIACCKGAYGGQVSGKCLSMLPSPPTTSPTAIGGLDYYYPDYETSWAEAGCLNTRPLPFGPGDRPTYTTMIACCKGAYGGQVSGKCLSMLPSPPTTSPTAVGGLDYYYPDYDTAWSEATCVNTRPLPFGPGDRPTYDTMIECCKAAYAGQSSGKCLSMLPSPPTTSPTTSGGLEVYYPDYTLAWTMGKCTNARPMPSGRPTYTTKSACCSGAYGGQSEYTCLCDAIGVCASCKCGSAAERLAAGCTITCE